MDSLENITITLPSSIAQIYQQATPEQQKKLHLKLLAMIELELTSLRQKAIAKLQQTMDHMSQEAQANGLTPEILESILQDESTI